MSIIRGYPDYVTLSIMYTIKTKPNTTYKDLVMKHPRLGKLIVKRILQQLFEADIVYKDRPEDDFFYLTTKGELAWEDGHEKVQTQFDVLNVFTGRNGMTLAEISDELQWKLANAESFIMGMINDGLLTYLDEEEATRRNFRNAMLIRHLRTYPFQYLAITPEGNRLWMKLRKLPFIDEL